MLGESTETLKQTLKELGIVLKPVHYKMDVRPLLRLVLSHFFGPATGFVDMLADHVPNPIEGAKLKVGLAFSTLLRMFSGTLILFSNRSKTAIQDPSIHL